MVEAEAAVKERGSLKAIAELCSGLVFCDSIQTAPSNKTTWRRRKDHLWLKCQTRNSG